MNILRRICTFGIHAAAIVVVLTMLAIVVNAVFRYFLGGTIYLVIELSGFIFLWIIFLAVAGTYLASGHVTVELVSDLMPPRLRHFVTNVVMTVFAIVYAAMIGWAGIVVTRDLIADHETSTGLTQFLLWPVFIIMPMGCFFLLLALIYRLFSSLSGGPEAEAEAGPETAQLQTFE